MAKARTSIEFAMVLVLIGGFLDTYTFLLRDGVFAGAQSGNIVQLGVHLAEFDRSDLLRLTIPVLGFGLGAFYAALLQQTKVAHRFRTPYRAALISEIVVLSLVGIIPISAPDIPVSALVAFAAGIQVATFRRVRDWTYSSTLATINMMNTITATTNAVVTNDPHERLRARTYGALVLSFLTGAALGGVSADRFGPAAIYVAVAGLVGLIVYSWTDEESEMER